MDENDTEWVVAFSIDFMDIGWNFGVTVDTKTWGDDVTFTILA